MNTWKPTKDMAEKVISQYGSPSYLYNVDSMIESYNNIREKLDKKYELFYSLKANPNISIVKAFYENGLGAEVSSRTELETALLAGIPSQKIIFVGPGKTTSELERAIDLGLLAIVSESIEELEFISKYSESRNLKTNVMLRVNPSFEASGSALAMGGKPRQFGIDEEIVIKESKYIKDLRGITIIGAHIYVGTRFLNYKDIIRNSENILKTIISLQDIFGYPFDLIDIGGGWGVPYFDNEAELDLNNLIIELNNLSSNIIKSQFRGKVIIELGRYLTASHGVLLTTVNYIKESRGVKFAITDGGTNIQLGAVGLGGFVKRNFPIINITAPKNKSEEFYITGPLCTPTDTVAKNITISLSGHGNIIATLQSGAYGPTASPIYFLGHGYPAEIIIKNNSLHLVRVRDTYKDLLKNQILI